jgi:5-methylcytosine-specific restriction protein A
MLDYNLLPTSREARQKFYQSKAWRLKRQQILLNEPLCRFCKLKGVLRLAEVVDHIEDLQVAPHLCLETENLRPLCTQCHNKRTANTNNTDSTGMVNGAIDFSILD